jgi:hypothetical protein
MGVERAALRFSRRAALALGIFLICIETWRRSHQLGDPAMWPSIFDDYLGGAFLIAASLIARRSVTKGRTWLAAGWGGATGMMFGSFFGQLMQHHAPDPSGVPTSCVVAFKGVLFALCIAGLTATLRSHDDGR